MVAHSTVPPAPDPKSTSTGPVVLSRVVGEVADHIVTSREVQINEALEQALGQPASQALRFLTGREPAFSASVTRVLDEWAVYLEAQAFQHQAIPRSESQRRLKSALEVLSGRADWKRLEAVESELREQMERKLTARGFMDLKAEASQAPVTDADAQAYFKKNRLKFGNLPFDDFRDNIKAFLAKQQSERRLKEWYDVLGRKYRARNYVAG